MIIDHTLNTSYCLGRMYQLSVVLCDCWYSHNMLVHICEPIESAHVCGYFSVSLFDKIVRLEVERVDIEVNKWQRGRQRWLHGWTDCWIDRYSLVVGEIKRDRWIGWIDEWPGWRERQVDSYSNFNCSFKLYLSACDIRNIIYVMVFSFLSLLPTSLAMAMSVVLEAFFLFELQHFAKYTE